MVLRPQLGFRRGFKGRYLLRSPKTANCLWKNNSSRTPHTFGSNQGGTKNTYTKNGSIQIYMDETSTFSGKHCFKSAFLDHGKLVVLPWFSASNQIKSPFWFCEITKFVSAPPLDLQDRSPRVESGCCC
jgi:hypothetical protein